jgi:Protein of unknown function (DUF3501)
MQPVSLSEIKSIADYEIERETFRPVAMAVKDRRRIRAGDHLTFLFENRLTVRYQIQEMMRIERLAKLAEIKHEVETYNELIPGLNQLSACLLIEYETVELRSVWLTALLGLENHIWIEVPGLGRAKAVFDDRQIDSDRISSVQYIKFQLTPRQTQQFSNGANIVVDHPKYAFSQPLSTAQLEELSADLT